MSIPSPASMSSATATAPVAAPMHAGTPSRPGDDTPQALQRLLMRRAAWVAVAVLGLAVALGLTRMVSDADQEVDAALSLAAFVARLHHVEGADAVPLRELVQDVDLRHLRLHARTPQGELWLDPQVDPDSVLEASLGSLLRRFEPVDTRVVVWQVQRGAQGPVAVTLAPSRHAERREAVAGLGESMLLIVGAVVAMLILMRLNMRHALQPLNPLLQAIRGIGSGDMRALQALPAMPVSELEAIAQALRRQAERLHEVEAQRRLLSHKLLTLQEDERANIARELHDELGQRLTAMRVQLAWARNEARATPALSTTLAEVADDCGLVQQDVRVLLARLQPFGAVPGESQHEALAQVAELLRSLAASWNLPGGPQVRLVLEAEDATGVAVPWPEGAVADAIGVPRTLALAIYRISQEALTNVVRHAQASQAELRLALRADVDGLPVHMRWSVRDDGIGLGESDAALRRGRGLAGIHERAWALGTQLQIAPAQPGAAREGLQLSVAFEVECVDLSLLARQADESLGMAGTGAGSAPAP